MNFRKLLYVATPMNWEAGLLVRSYLPIMFPTATIPQSSALRGFTHRNHLFNGCEIIQNLADNVLSNLKESKESRVCPFSAATCHAESAFFLLQGSRQFYTDP
eukprot:Gregarina_sp_Poly_1__8217@NODE_4780_length_495_cov_13_207944_g3280_i0_p1_GENE_NODE_4780_length_495_cov_13_207944_g3280_i0NODE_4780_length_495_cov_13_207944_g3280_i0_p1_ORF_typecomplete_len103_score13_47_NODE_4780_length_495_cov_13_207944_g3280_i068376